MTCTMSAPIKWVLALSLLLNVLMAGFTIGRMSGMPHGHGRGGMDFPKTIAGLPIEKQKMVDEIWADFRNVNNDTFKQIKQIRADIVAIMEAPEFDEAAFRAKSAELSKLMVASKKNMVDHMATVAKEFTQEERKALVRHMRRPPPAPMGPPDGQPEK